MATMAAMEAMAIINLRIFGMKKLKEMIMNKLGLSWAKLSSSWDWGLLQL